MRERKWRGAREKILIHFGILFILLCSVAGKVGESKQTLSARHSISLWCSRLVSSFDQTRHKRRGSECEIYYQHSEKWRKSDADARTGCFFFGGWNLCHGNCRKSYYKFVKKTFTWSHSATSWSQSNNLSHSNYKKKVKITDFLTILDRQHRVRGAQRWDRRRERAHTVCDRSKKRIDSENSDKKTRRRF